MRGVWAELQNAALERAGAGERVDHRSLEAQREAAAERGDLVTAEELDRAPEVKLGPAVNAMERRAVREAKAEGRAYKPVTERGRAVYEAGEARRVFAALREELRERVEAAREAYGAARGEGQDRISAGLAAMRAALEKQREAPEAGESVGDRLRRMLGREQERGGGEAAGRTEQGPDAAGIGSARLPDQQASRERPAEPPRGARGRGRQCNDDRER